ncbi:MAG: hypothetical protein KIS81_11580 [Maricaulaceae bacterium]|nr:hypothetical protein [Maricaulaceae bacterium]
MFRALACFLLVSCLAPAAAAQDRSGLAGGPGEWRDPYYDNPAGGRDAGDRPEQGWLDKPGWRGGPEYRYEERGGYAEGESWRRRESGGGARWGAGRDSSWSHDSGWTGGGYETRREYGYEYDSRPGPAREWHGQDFRGWRGDGGVHDDDRTRRDCDCRCDCRGRERERETVIFRHGGAYHYGGVGGAGHVPPPFMSGNLHPGAFAPLGPHGRYGVHGGPALHLPSAGAAAQRYR